MKNTDRSSPRFSRKDEHVQHFLEVYQGKGNNGFEDIIIQNNSIPELDFEKIETVCTFLGKTIGFPLMINAITGGTDYTGKINRQLAELSRKYNLPIAAGSQTIAIEDPSAQDTFKVIRDINRDGIVIANVSANSCCDKVLKAIEMLEADAIQLHLNVPQEICMSEGDRRFEGILDNISEILKHVKKPVIVKEVGFGISYETAVKLAGIGVEYLDTGGKGGTNFIEIEDKRRKSRGLASRDSSFLYDWGIPSALSLLECRRANDSVKIICSGGIRKADEIVKSLCMGADLSAISGVLLYELMKNGPLEADKLLERLTYEVRVIMLLVGAGSIEQLKKVPYLIKGTLKELYENKFA